jgi:sigma-B regulation protein RsbU (phosphoserine phosphatase)
MNDRSEIEHLRTLVEASKLINSSIEPDALFASILSVARQQLGVERGTLYFVDNKNGEIWSKVAGELGDIIRLPIGRGIAGSVAATGEQVLLHDAYADERFDPSYDLSTGYRTRSMLCTPIKNRSGVIVGVLQLLNKVGGSFGPVDLRFLDAISDHMAIAMENATIHLALVQMERMERELQLGREIQSELLPPAPDGLSGVAIAAMSIPCYEVGGDYYDFLPLPGEELGVVIGDVSGKGVGAALIMSSLQAALRVAGPIEDDMAMLLSRLNTFLFQATRGRKYVTFFYGRYTPSTGLLRYVNAGHNPPFVVANGRVEILGSTGKPIGILPDSRYDTASITLPPGATLILYTDGLNEATNGDDEELGNERLATLVRETSEGDVDSMPGRMLAAVTAFEAGTPPTDDKTIVVLRRLAPGA